jgi:choline dehydrogenase-like flavoprotein
VSRTELVSDVVVCNPLSAQFLSVGFIDWFAVGMPVDAASAGRGRRSHEGPIRVLHAPTRPQQKGSDLIEEAFRSVTALGVHATFEMLTGVPNAAVRTAIEGADLVVDELYSDSFMGGLGVEAAVSGTPCLTFGYGGDALAGLPGAAGYPLLGYGHPRTLEQRLLRAVTDAEWRADLARQAEHFVATEWSPTSVAQRILVLAEGAAPDHWVVAPEGVAYACGFGVPAERLRSVLEQYLQRFGEEGLCLSATSPVRSALVDLARGVGIEGAPADGPKQERLQ